jgi:uncharacterized membrane protein YfcA
MDGATHPYVLVCIIIFLAGLTQGLSGFGSVLFSIPLLAAFLDIKTVIPLAALIGLSMSLVLLFQLRSYLDWKKIYPLLIAAIPGIPVGVIFLKRLDRTVILYVLGILLIAYSLYSLLSRSTGKQLRGHWAYVFGFLAGCLGGAFGAAGPAVIVYTSLQTWGKDQIKVTLQGFFAISGGIVVLFQALNGLTTLAVWRFYGVSLPMLILGAYVGSLFYGMIREETYRRVMSLLLGFLGVFMICRA